MPEKPPRPESLDDGWDIADDEPPAAPKEGAGDADAAAAEKATGKTSGRDARPAGETSSSPTRGGTLSYEELRAAGVPTPEPEPMPDPSAVRGGTLTWAELLGDPPPPAPKPKPAPRAPEPKPEKPIRGGTRNIDELLAKTPPLPQRPPTPSPVASPVRQGTRTWGDKKVDAPRPVTRTRTPSAVRGGTRPIDELVQKRAGAGGLDDLPVGDVLQRMSSEPPSSVRVTRSSRAHPDSDAPSIEIVAEEPLDEPLDEDDEDEANGLPK